MNQPIVIDNGTGLLKAGFAGSDKPRVTFRSSVGRVKHRRMMPGGALSGSDIFIGTKAEEHRGALLLSYPMEHGIIQDWGDMERVWRHIYIKENLNVASEDHAVSSQQATLYTYYIIYFQSSLSVLVGSCHGATIESYLK